MKKFGFKLERLLKIKEHNENLAKEAYGRELQKKISLDIENKQMEDAILNDNEKNFSMFNKGESISSNVLFMQQDYIDGLIFKIYENNIKKKEMEPNLQKLKEQLMIATREKKTFEKLKEKEFQYYKEDYRKNQTKILDEVSAHRYILNVVEE
jgi:flagellar protein FliJ